MRTKSILLILVFLFIISNHSFSQSKSEKVKTRMIELFELVKENNYSDAASYLVYRGEDKSRKWKDHYDYNNETEGLDVDRLCKEINAMLTGGGGYEFVKFRTETESEGQWCIWELKFENIPDSKFYFACLKIKGKYCLGDID